MRHYYNDNSRYAAAWLVRLIKAGAIPPGVIDRRDIRKVQADDVRDHEHVHLFAGIGGWALAAACARRRPGKPVWTVSCPCPPLSVAGRKKTCPRCASSNLVPCPRRTGFFICCACEHAWEEDDRHLWPEVWRLIAECRPPVIYGEQVPSTIGRAWFAGVRASCEILGYSVTSAGLPAASVGAPQLRHRLWFKAKNVADLEG